jgi:hypothetical protein
MANVKTEGVYGAEFLLSNEETLSLDKGVLISGQNLNVGTVLGKITASGKYTLHNNAASDGSEVAAAILYNTTDASVGDTACTVLTRLAEVAEAKLIFKSGISVANKAAAIAALATQHIITRS